MSETNYGGGYGVRFPPCDEHPLHLCFSGGKVSHVTARACWSISIFGFVSTYQTEEKKMLETRWKKICLSS